MVLMSIYTIFLLILCCFVHSSYAASSSAAKFQTKFLTNQSKASPTCPNDQYLGNGQLQSPNWPNYYGNNEDCIYFMTAAPGFVSQIHFWAFDTELCCDYVDLFDGPDVVNSAKIGRISGASINPTTYAASSRWLTMQFHTDATVTRPGFNASYYSTRTSTAIQRSGQWLTTKRSESSTDDSSFEKMNFVIKWLQELRFVANILLANWSIGHSLTQVVPALMETDEMTSYDFDEIKSLAELQRDILNYGSKPIQGEDPDALEAVFYLITPRITNDLAYKSGARHGINRILVLFLSFMPNDASDLNGSIRYANQIKAEGTKIAIVGMGPSVDVTALMPLSSGPKYLFSATSYADLSADLANDIKQVICLDS